MIAGLSYWDDRDSNPDALSSSKFSHHYSFRCLLRQAQDDELAGVVGPDCALTV
jgi:hypothetical protein